MRIDKFLSNLKYGSRKEIAIYIKKGFVKVNDELISNAKTNINPSLDIVSFQDETVYYKESIMLMMNKLKG